MPAVEGSPNRDVMIVLAYLWLLALVPLLAEKRDPDLQWHARHGLALMVAELLLFFAYALVTSVVSLPSVGLGWMQSLVLVFGWIGVLALHIVAILRGVKGARLILPIVSRYAGRPRQGR